MTTRRRPGETDLLLRPHRHQKPYGLALPICPGLLRARAMRTAEQASEYFKERAKAFRLNFGGGNMHIFKSRSIADKEVAVSTTG